MAEPIKMPFGLWASMGPRNHILDEILIIKWEWAILGEWVPIVKRWDCLP